MTVCKYCKSKDLKVVCKDGLLVTYKCNTCKKSLSDDEVLYYITFCPYCKEYLADCDYKHCMYCGKVLNKKLKKVKVEEVYDG